MIKLFLHSFLTTCHLNRDSQCIPGGKDTFCSRGTGTGKNLPKDEPERFYHGFVLGLIVELQGKYLLTSNWESEFGRYDVMLEPLHPADDAIILEFKVFQPKKEKTLADTVDAVLRQIENKNYESILS